MIRTLKEDGGSAVTPSPCPLPAKPTLCMWVTHSPFCKGEFISLIHAGLITHRRSQCLQPARCSAESPDICSSLSEEETPWSVLVLRASHRDQRAHLTLFFSKDQASQTPCIGGGWVQEVPPPPYLRIYWPLDAGRGIASYFQGFEPWEAPHQSICGWH